MLGQFSIHYNAISTTDCYKHMTIYFTWLLFGDQLLIRHRLDSGFSIFPSPLEEFDFVDVETASCRNPDQGLNHEDNYGTRIWSLSLNH